MHIEMGPQGEFEFSAVAPYLALLGDIGQPKKPNYKQFLLKQAQRFQKVFVLAGNHEFFNHSWAECRNDIEQICASHPNLVFMDRRSVIVDHVKFVGATLWSHVSDSAGPGTEKRWNDYTQIGVFESGKKRNIKYTDTNQWYKDDLKYIKEEISTSKHPVVVLTHHCPLFSSPGCATDLSSVMKSPVAAWCYGHTHQSTNLFKKKVRVLSNQLGYEYCMGEKDPAFKTELVLGIDESGKTWTWRADSRDKPVQKEEIKAVILPVPAPPPLPPTNKLKK
uniref:Calcineurin-like phosphoesterase domain-containing protein n=1 Tax=Arcella intermedia TaxID=1963864 RepID=A0A6B2LCM3_9EUKA